jgi:Domain of unknown function (DUF4157)
MAGSVDWAGKDAESAKPPEPGAAAGLDHSAPQNVGWFALALRPPVAGDAQTRGPEYFRVHEQVEHALGVDLSHVAIHTDAESAAEARELGARAYTVGQNVHFGAGRFEPGTAEGKRLIAHELVHTLQQRDAPASGAHDVSSAEDASEREATALAGPLAAGVASRVTQRPGRQLARDDEEKLDFEPKKWDPQFIGHRAAVGHPLAEYKKGIEMSRKAGGWEVIAPDLQPASEWVKAAGTAQEKRGTKLKTIELTESELLQVMLAPAGTPGYDPRPDFQNEVRNAVKAHLPRLNEAFKLMQLNTVEAQAVYLAHAFSESGQLTRFEELSAGKKDYAPFIGRGPVQVTWSSGYIRALAYMEVEAERLLKAGQKGEAQKLAAAVRAIKADIKQAAKPEYTFIFSAAFMHAVGGVQRAAGLAGTQPTFGGAGAEDTWMTGGLAIEKRLTELRQNPSANAAKIKELEALKGRAAMKRAAYERAVAVLSAKKVDSTP